MLRAPSPRVVVARPRAPGHRRAGLGGVLASVLGCVTASATCAPIGPDDVIVQREDIDGAFAGADAGDDADAGSADTGADAGADDAGSADAGSADAGSADAGSADAGSADAGSADAGVVVDEPDFASLPWETGDDVGLGVARKDTGNPRGDSAAVVYGGYGSTLDAACAWAGALYEATLRARGVRFVYCVQGPATVQYVGREIGNSRIARHLVARVTDRTRFVLVAGHSSGSFVAHELLQQLQGGFDDDDVTSERVVYVNLDGGASGLSPAVVDRLRRAYFVAAVDGLTATQSPNRATMVSLGSTYASRGRAVDLDASDAGCAAGAVWCVHMAPVISRPHDPLRADVTRDYSAFDGRPVVTSWIDDVADEAGLVLP
jgi:hypothetical protein